MRCLAVLVLALASCGRLGFEAVGMSGDGGDGGSDDDAAPPCTPGAWSTPQHQTRLASPAEDWEPALSPDGLVVVFSSGRINGTLKLYVATRASTGAQFGDPRFMQELSAGPGLAEHGPMWSHDGARLYYASEMSGALAIGHSQPGSDQFDLPPAAVDLLGENWALSIDETELFFTDYKSPIDADLHHATRATPTAPWQRDDRFAGVNTTDGEGWPSFDEARRDLYIEQNAAIRVAHRDAGPATSFDAFVDVPGLGSEIGDPDISHDGLTIVFGSTAAPSAGGNDIFVATRTCD